jgi:hypothetical protein
MEQNSYQSARALYDFLTSRRKIVEVTAAGIIKVDGERILDKNCLQFLQNQASVNPTLAPCMLIPTNEFLIAFRGIVNSELRKAPDYEQVTIESYDYSNLIPFQAITDASKTIIFDTSTSSITDIDYSTFKSNRETAKIEPIRGRIEFNPYSPLPITFKEDRYGRQCNFINTYKKPAWQYNIQLSVDESRKYEIPQLFNEFFEHLIPDNNCRMFTYDWLHYALTDRCETYLVLNGAKGIGKNVLSELLCKPLMGTANHKIAQPSALTSDFNALLENSRMIVFDEFRVDTAEKINKLKRYVNEEQMIEKKGVDVSNTIKTFNSFIISNNDLDDMKIAWDDRRFSVVDLTETKLRDVWKKDKIDRLISMFEDVEAMRNFGYWLMYRVPLYTKFDAWKGNHFYKLCYASFKEWQKVIIDLAMSRQYEELTAADIRKEYRKRTDSNRIPNITKIKDFLMNYRHEGIHRIGELRENGEVFTIILDDIFCPATTQDDSEDIGGLLS